MKGQEHIAGLMSLTMVVVLAFVLQYILPGQATKITPEVEAHEFENKAILLTNTLLANPDLMYSNNRGTLSVKKINDIFYEDTFGIELYTCKPDLDNCKLPTFPETFTFVVLVNMENGKGWFTGTHRLTGNEPRVTNIRSCFQDRLSTNYPQLFQVNSDVGEVLELKKCNLQRYSTALNKGFPVTIRYCPSSHPNEFNEQCYKVETCGDNQTCDPTIGCIADPGNMNHDVCWYEPVSDGDIHRGVIKVLVVE